RADSNAVDFWRKQANWVVVGVFAFMLTSLIHYRWIRWGALPMYLAGIVFLILTKFIGTKVYGARSWLYLGPVNFQPAQLAFIPIAINFGLKPYQQQRITAFTHPDIDKQGSAWAINQSLIAIGSGGWSGKGFKAPNTQIELGFLPATAVHNDYIFSAIGEQWG